MVLDEQSWRRVDGDLEMPPQSPCRGLLREGGALRDAPRDLATARSRCIYCMFGQTKLRGGVHYGAISRDASRDMRVKQSSAETASRWKV